MKELRLQESFRPSGEVRALVIDGDIAFDQVLPMLAGAAANVRIVSDQTWPNLVTNVGRQQMTKLIVGETTAVARYMGLSTSAPPLALTDLALTNEIYRGALSVYQSFGLYSQRYVAYFPTAAFGSTGLVGEALYDTVTTGGNMWAQAAIVVSKSTTQALILDHRILASS